MKHIFLKIAAAVTAALIVSSVSVSAMPTNTSLDYILGNKQHLNTLGLEFYKTLENEAKKGINGALADPTRGERVPDSTGKNVYALKALTIEGSTTFDARASDAATAARDALGKALGTVREDVLSEINETYSFFINDHPELFWLTGNSSAYVTTNYTYSTDGRVEFTVSAYLILRDETGSETMDIRHEKYRSTTAIATDTARLEAAINEIFNLPYVKAATAAEDKIRAFNKALTERNAYYRDPQGNPEGFESHECISALIGGTGTSGPVCEGYSKAFKVLCDRVGIPSSVVQGYTYQQSGEPARHAWNAVTIYGCTYAVDVTFNDPFTTDGKAVSGYESDKYLLVGDYTQIDGKEFGKTHIPDNYLILGDGLTVELAAPELMQFEFDADKAFRMPFTDVYTGASYYEYVADAYRYKFMNGVSETEFAPDSPLTRAMLVTVLWRYDGRKASDKDLPFTDVAKDMWYTDAVKWAYELGIVNGMDAVTFAPDSPVTREQALTMFRRYSELEANRFSADHYERNAVIPGYVYSGWAKDGVNFGYALDYLRLEYDLTAPLTRKEAARYMSRLLWVNVEI